MSIRIIGGKYRSRLISMPKGVDMRPTQDKIREAIFNMLGDVSGMRILELFAGTGAFGIEAISRDAAHATFVDNNHRCTNTIESNLESLNIDRSSYDIIKADAVKMFSKREPDTAKYDIVFMDPPYYRELAKKCLINIDAYDILTRVGFLFIEHFKKDIMPTGLKTLVFYNERRYGDTVITIFRRAYDKDQDSGLPGNVRSDNLRPY